MARGIAHRISFKRYWRIENFRQQILKGKPRRWRRCQVHEWWKAMLEDDKARV